jgi:hypothetical protein
MKPPWDPPLGTFFLKLPCGFALDHADLGHFHNFHLMLRVIKVLILVIFLFVQHYVCVKLSLVVGEGHGNWKLYLIVFLFLSL